jgi:hypothetical protein
MTQNIRLQQAIEAREKFLNEHPHLRSYQAEIDAIMDKVPEKQRLEVIHQLALEKMMNLKDAMGQLKGALDEAARRD